jgi:hypothetical protein
VLIYALVARTFARERVARLMGFFLSAYFFRVFDALFVARDFAFFSHGALGGDSIGYEYLANDIARMWGVAGFSFVTGGAVGDIEGLGQVALHCNLLAVISFISGGSFIAMASSVAFIACLTGYILHRFCTDLGATDVGADRAMLLLLFSPAFIFYTSDTYKDGLNLLLVVSAVFLTTRLAHRFRLLEIAVLMPVLWGLWYVRRYMVFMCLVPIVFSFVSFHGKSPVRAIFMVAVLALVGIVGSSAFINSEAAEAAVTIFERGTSTTSLEYNAAGGSGVMIEGNGPAAIALKLIYTVFSPFLWSFGSLGLQLGKIDTVIWYYTLYHAWHASKELWKTRRDRLIPIIAFVIPATYAYALSFSNVGLIFRQRLPIVVLVSAIAAVSWGKARVPARAALRTNSQSPLLRPRMARR